MTNQLTLSTSIPINATPALIWEWLTTPELIKQYFFGTNAVSNWKKGSTIYFRGEWEGKPYEDKGVILDIEPEKFIRYTYWSAFSGKPDLPENYAEVSYKLTPEPNGTLLTVTQGGIATEESLKHSEQNWQMVFGGLKKLLEQR